METDVSLQVLRQMSVAFSPFSPEVITTMPSVDFFAPLGIPKPGGVPHCTISKNVPEEADVMESERMMDCFRACDVMQSTSELQRREKIVQRLESLFREWLVEMCESLGVPEIVRDTVGGKVVPFGSYQLGVHSKGADIDLLCVGPYFLKRRLFFTSFLKKLEAQKEVKKLWAIESAFVPLIKMTYDGIEVDLLFARLNIRAVSKNVDLLNNQLLREMDKKCVTSLNGFRVTQEILQSVPNVENFRTTLQIIKFWAKRRNIYSNKFGFLGGVSWALLVARTCQMFPNAAVSTLVTNFFKVWSKWAERPTPVHLKNVNNWEFNNLPFWDPETNLSDRKHLMAIITPAYPQQNSSVNVNRSTLKTIREELQRGNVITEEILQKTADWSKLLDAQDFQGENKHLILLRAAASTKRQHLEWTSLVESKIRFLVSMMERHEYICVVRVHQQSFTSCIVDVNGRWGRCTTWLLGLGCKVPGRRPQMIDLTSPVESFKDTVYSLAISSNILEEGMSLNASYSTTDHVTLKTPEDGEAGVSMPTLRAEVQPHLQFYVVPPPQAPAVTVGPSASKRKCCFDSEAPAKRIRTEKESVENPSSGQASTPDCEVSASEDPQVPVRRPSAKRPRPSEESDPDTTDPSSEKLSTESAQTSGRQSSGPASPSRPATPELDDVPKKRFRSESPTVEPCDEPHRLDMPVRPMKRVIKFKLIKSNCRSA